MFIQPTTIQERSELTYLDSEDTNVTAALVSRDNAAPFNESSAAIVQSLTRQSDLDLLSYCRNVLGLLEGNPNFPLLQGALPLAQAQVDQIGSLLAEIKSAESQLKTLHAMKSASRIEVERVFRTLGLLVQAESHGNPAKIAGAGMRQKSKGRPTTDLPFPTNLQVQPGANTGHLNVIWNPVRRSKGYLLQLSKATNPREWTFQRITGKARIQLTDLEPGTTYVVRVCTLGSTQGQSSWSPEVTRICA